MKKQTYKELEKRVKELERAEAEHIRVEETLRLQSEVLENIAEGVYLIRTNDGVIVYANPTFENMFGYDSGELINKHVSIVNAPSEKSPEETAKEIIRDLKKKGTWSGEVRNIRKDGTQFWCNANVSTFVHHNYGEVWVSVHEDITKRKQLEEELKRHHDHLEELIEERTAELITANKRLKEEITERRRMELDLKERIKELNGLYNLGKLTEQVEDLEELLNRFMKDVVPPSMQFPDKVFSKVELDGKKYLSFGKEDLCDGKDCLYAPIIIKGEERGKLCVGYTEDLPFIEKYEQNLIDAYAERLGKIIDRRETEKALKESEEKFRTFMETASDLMHIADKDGNLTYVNEAMAKTLGYTKEEMIGMNVTQLVTKEMVEKHYESLWKELTTKGSFSFEPTWVTKDGKEIYGEINVIAIYDRNGEYSGSRGILRDTTERRQLEEERIKTSKLEAINNLIVTLNHEMNQSLSVIISYAYYIMESAEKESQLYKDVKLIHEEAWKISNLVKKISKIKEIKISEYSKGTKMLDLSDTDKKDKDEG